MYPERVAKLAMLERVRFIALGCLVLGLVTQAGGVSAQTTDPLSVVKGFFAAQCVGDLQSAMALVADDAVIVNGRGKTVDPRAFVQGNSIVRLCIEIQRARVSGEKVFWTNTVATTFLDQLGIASMEVNADAVVRGGKIVANRNYHPPRTLALLRQACETAQERTIHLWPNVC